MQVEKIKIHASLRPTELEKETPSDWITGILYLQVGDEFFPAQGGGDYVLINLASWMDNAHRLALPDFEVTNGFRENTSTFVLTRPPHSEQIQMKLFDKDGSLISEHLVSLARYLAALRGTAKILLGEIEVHELSRTGYGFALRDSLAHLEHLEERIKTQGLP